MNNYTLKEICDLYTHKDLDYINIGSSWQGDNIIGLVSLLMNATTFKYYNPNYTAGEYRFTTLFTSCGLDYTKYVYFKENEEGETPHWIEQDTPQARLMSLIYARYGNDYIASSEIDIYANPNHSYVKEVFGKFAQAFIGILASTENKYVNILNIYNDNISKLMDGLKGKTDVEHENHRDEDYDTDVTGKNLLNDTPTTTDVISDLEQNQFVSELSKSTAHTDNVGDVDEEGESHTTSENNTKYVMEKIKDIQDNYQKVLYEWSEEFAPLFIEEV